MDSIASCHSGHLGLPLGCAEIGAVLFGTDAGLTYNPEDPQWINRDRFILSAGHGSMFLYSWLHLAGYDLPLEEVKNFRRCVHVLLATYVRIYILWLACTACWLHKHARLQQRGLLVSALTLVCSKMRTLVCLPQKCSGS